MNAADAVAGWYEVRLIDERRKGQDVVADLTRPWPLSPLMPRTHGGWFNVWVVNDYGKWTLKLVPDSSVRLIVVGRRLDKPPTDNA